MILIRGTILGLPDVRNLFYEENVEDHVDDADVKTPKKTTFSPRPIEWE